MQELGETANRSDALLNQRNQKYKNGLRYPLDFLRCSFYLLNTLRPKAPRACERNRKEI